MQNDPNNFHNMNQANLAKRRFSLQNTTNAAMVSNNYGSKFNPNDIFVDQTNLQELRKLASGGGNGTAGGSSMLLPTQPQPPPPPLPPHLAAPLQSSSAAAASSSLYDPNSTYSRFLLYQQQQQQTQLQQMQQKQRQQQQAAQNQENFSNFMRLCNYSGIDLNADLTNNNDETFFSGDFSTASTADSYSISSSQSSLSSQPTSSIFAQQQQQQQQFLPSSKLTPISPAQQTLQFNNRRRCSFGPSVSSSLHPVFESPRSTSPFTLPSYTPSPLAGYDQQQQQQQQQKLEQKLSSLIMSSQLISEPTTPPPTPPMTTTTTTAKPIRGSSMSSSSLQTMTPSIETTRSRVRALSTSSSVSSFDLSSLPKQVFADSFEEKLATTGNIFQKRDDWSVLNRIPIVKQNTIHIRLEDEGPYGNDETRCFVLSHFSSLGIKELNCIVCSSQMIVYDRFPLVDGTLFLSPVMYDAKKSISATVGNKQQYINAICLSCILGDPGHELTCKSCRRTLQSQNAVFSVQLGTLYKYDLFAAFPCCKHRLTCKKCHQVIGDLNADGFSSFSEERECPNCKTRDYHFIKPINQIFLPQKLQQTSN